MPTRVPLLDALGRLNWASRKRSATAIKDGRVLVNDDVETDLHREVDVAKDSIAVDGFALSAKPSAKATVVWNRPAGISGDDIPIKWLPWFLTSGLLPQTASGIVLLTNDREYARPDSAPIAQLTQDFRLRLNRTPTDTELKSLDQQLHDRFALPEGSLIGDIGETSRGSWLSIVGARFKIQACAQELKPLGLEILAWERTRLGPFNVNELERGAWQRLTDLEVAALDDMVSAGINDATPLENVYEEIVRSASN